MPTTVFFSWQSTRPGRNLIEKALQDAIKRISVGINLEEPERGERVELELDRDTKNVAGSPAIFDTILKKIVNAAIFVSDLTFVGTSIEGNLLPNPNVLIEHGYALRVLGDGRIIGVMNSSHGQPKDLPFDLKTKRFPILYELPDDADDTTRTNVRNKLSKELEGAIRAILEDPEYLAGVPKPPEPPLRQPRMAKSGEGRFRRQSEALGVARDMESQILDNDREPIRYLLNDGPAMWLRVMTNLAPTQTLAITELGRRVGGLGTFPLVSLGGTTATVASSDGVGMCFAVGSDKTPNVVFAFKDGEIWAINTFTPRNRPQLIILQEPIWTNSLKAAADFLSAAGFTGPYRWIAGMEGVNGRYLMPKDDLNRRFGPCLSDIIMEQRTFNLQDDPAASLEPFFAAVWDQCQVQRPAR
jgi:hypothetical protein